MRIVGLARCNKSLKDGNYCDYLVGGDGCKNGRNHVMNEDQALHIVDLLLDNLRARSGFDHWWDGIDEDTKWEIHRELSKIVENNS